MKNKEIIIIPNSIKLELYYCFQNHLLFSVIERLHKDTFVLCLISQDTLLLQWRTNQHIYFPHEHDYDLKCYKIHNNFTLAWICDLMHVRTKLHIWNWNLYTKMYIFCVTSKVTHLFIQQIFREYQLCANCWEYNNEQGWQFLPHWSYILEIQTENKLLNKQ